MKRNKIGQTDVEVTNASSVLIGTAKVAILKRNIKVLEAEIPDNFDAVFMLKTH